MDRKTNLRITWFSEMTRKKIVEEAKRILDEIGVFVENDEALSLLASSSSSTTSCCCEKGPTNELSG